MAPKKTKIVRMAVNEFERRLNELQVAPILGIEHFRGCTRHAENLEPLNSETELELERKVRAIQVSLRV